MTANTFSTLELTWCRREGGRGKTQRDYLDFVVDGQSLSDLLHANGWVGCLGWLKSEVEQNVVERLLVKHPSELGNNRYSLYICPECGKIGCGAFTAAIRETVDGYYWEHFGFENDYSDAMSRFKEFEDVGPFRFKKDEYIQVLVDRPRPTTS
jgi:hypothetical protein